MSIINTAITKQPFKLIEIPLNKFRDEAVPHHCSVFETHKITIQKLIHLNNVQQLNREVKDKKRIIRQLKDLMYELDTLRTQVEDSDLGKFDSKTLSLRKTILKLISSYAALEAEVAAVVKVHIEENESRKNDSPTNDVAQLQIHGNLDELKLRENKQKLQQVEALNKDIEDVQEIFVDLNQMVGDQKEHVDMVETNIEVANENVNSGLRQLIQASRLKKASYPVAGAFIGTMVGGPIGSVAGLKIGAIAALSCGLAGYVSGKFIKKANENEISSTETDLTTINNANVNLHVDATEKKDI